MSVASQLSAVLQIKEGEGRPIFLLMGLSYFSGWALALYYITSTTIFLERFDTQMLPMAYAVAGVVGYLSWWLLSKIDKKLTAINQLILKTLIVLVSVLFFSLGNQFFPSDELAFVMFIWFRVLAFISVVVFWGVAGRLFDLRQGKRVFGLVSTGEVLSDIVGFFSIPLLLRYINYSELLYLACFSMLICLVLLIVIVREFRSKIQPPEDRTKVVVKSNSKGSNFFEYLKEPYFRQIFLLAMIPIFGLMFIDFMFLDQTRQGFSDPEVLANFLSIFFGAVAIVELIIKIFLSGRIISKYGLKVGLLSLPVALLCSTLLASFSGLFYGPTVMFFSFIILLKLSDRSIRSAIYDPAFQILYQPLPAEERMDFQNKIEGVPKALGNTVAGLVLLGLTAIGLQNMVYYNLIFLVISIVWVSFTVSLYKEYRAKVRSVLMSKAGWDYEMRSFLKAGSLFFSDLLTSPIRKKAINTLNMMEKIEPLDREQFYKKLLYHPNARIRTEVLNRVGQHQLTSLAIEVENFSNEETNEKVVESAKETRKFLEKLNRYSFLELKEMSVSLKQEERLVVANLIGQVPLQRVNELFVPLLQDDDPSVRTAALLSVGKIQKRDLWPYLFDNLSHPLYSNASSSAIIALGEPILAELDILFSKMESDREAQYKIIRIIGRIGGRRAIWMLKNRFNYPVDNIRLHILICLSNMGYRATNSEFATVKQAVEYEIGNIVWVMAAILDLEGSDLGLEQLLKALENEVLEKTERVFLLLSLLYDSQAMKKVKDILENGQREERVFAIEIVDMMVADSVRDILIPLVDDNSLAEKIKLLDDDFPQEQLSASDRLKDIVNRDFITVNQWTRACALYAIGKNKMVEHKKLLAAHFFHNDFIVRQTAKWSMQQIDQELLFAFAHRLSPAEKRKFEHELSTIEATDSEFGLNLVFEKVQYLKSMNIFQEFPESFLVDLAELSEFVEVPNEAMLAKDENSVDMFKVVYGSVGGMVGEKVKSRFQQGQVISEMDFGTADWNALDLKSQEPTGLLRIPQEPLFESVSNHIFLAKLIARYIDNK